MNESDRIRKDRMTFATLRVIRGLSAREAAGNSTVSPSTVRAMRRPIKDGGTRHPQAHTLNRILEAHGYMLDVVPAPTHNRKGRK